MLSLVSSEAGLVFATAFSPDVLCSRPLMIDFIYIEVIYVIYVKL